MENFQDVLQQLNQQPAAANALRSVNSPDDLVAALESCLAVRGRPRDADTVDPRTALTAAMQELAVSTLSSHELQLVRWLAAGKV
jgi:hypothetical protein